MGLVEQDASPGRYALGPFPLAFAGTFAGMWVAGFSVDNLSLMALAISVGFVVDDAIVMLENIMRHVEAGMEPLHQTIRKDIEGRIMSGAWPPGTRVPVWPGKIPSQRRATLVASPASGDTRKAIKSATSSGRAR